MTKRVVETDEIEDAFEILLGETIVLICDGYIYSGELIAITGNTLELRDAVLVYETGKWSDSQWKDAQSLPGESWKVERRKVESWGTK